MFTLTADQYGYYRDHLAENNLTEEEFAQEDFAEMLADLRADAE